MGFFKSLRNIVTKVAPVAIGFAIGGPAGAAAGGALGSAARGGDLKQIIQGAGYGYGAGALTSAGIAGLNAASAASSLPATSGGIAWDSPAVTGLKTAGGQLIPGTTNVLSGNMGGASSVPGSIISQAGSAISSSPLSSLLQLGQVAGGIYSANQGAKAANTAAGQQAASATEAINAQKEALQQIRGDLAPFRQVGVDTAPQLSNMVNDPQAQLNFIQNNPFYQALAKDAKDKLFANQAARGKIGSGGTAEALQNSLLLLGNDLVNQNITQRQNLTTLGANAAAQTGTATQNSAQAVGGFLTDRGNANAAGTIGAYNAKTGAINNALGGLTSLYGIEKGIRV